MKVLLFALTFVLFASIGYATPITYSYIGHAFTTATGQNHPPEVIPSGRYTTSDFVYAEVTLDIIQGVAAFGLAPIYWSLDVTAYGSPMSPFPNWNTRSFEEDQFYCYDPYCSDIVTSFDVDSKGRINNWLMDAYSYHDTIKTSTFGDDVFNDEGSGWARGSGPAGTWTRVTPLPEPASLALLGIGLIGLIRLRRAT